MASLIKNKFIVAHCYNAGVCFASAKGHSRNILTSSVIKACHNLAAGLNARLKITKTRRCSIRLDLIADMLSKADFDAAVELMNQDREFMEVPRSISIYALWFIAGQRVH